VNPGTSPVKVSQARAEARTSRARVSPDRGIPVKAVLVASPGKGLDKAAVRASPARVSLVRAAVTRIARAASLRTSLVDP
jgi:hypothetical protein